MNILCVIDNLGSGGAQRQLVLLAIELKKRGYNLSFFTYYPQNFFKHELEENNIPIYFEPKKNKLGLDVINSIKRIMYEKKIDIGISFMKTPNIYLGIANLLGPKVKIISSERTRTDFKVEGLISKLRYFFHSKANMVIFNSFHEKQNWINRFPKLENHSITIYNGVDTNRFCPDDNNNNEFKYKLIGIGTIGPHKNLEIILEAIKALKSNGLNINLDWYGKVVKEDEGFVKYSEKIFDLLIQYDLHDNVKILPPTNDIHLIIKQYDALIHSSLIEGLPNVACESLSSGVPIIISNILDHPILVGKNFERGFLFNPNDSNSLVHAIQKVYNLDSIKFGILKENCRKFALDNLSIRKFVDEYKSVIDKI